MRRNWPAIAAAFLVFTTVAIIFFGEVVLHLWNWLMPSLFGLRQITFWEALGLMALSWILFGGRRGFHFRPRARGNWRERMRERWQAMTPEQRQKLSEAIRRRCGFPQEAAGPESANK